MVILPDEFNRENPFLSPAQAFARIYESPVNHELQKNEREGARRGLQEGFRAMMAPL
jgi:hypothetical protein